MVVDRRHTEDALTAQLEGADLQNHRQGFNHKHAAHDHQQELLTQQHGDNAQRAAQRQRTDVTHKDLRRISVEPEEAQPRADYRRTDDHQLTRVTQIRDVQVVRKVHVTGRPRHQRKTSRHEDGWHNRQTIQAIGQVNGVTGTNNYKVGQQDVEQPQLRHHVFKEGHHQFGGGRIFSCQIQREGDAQRNH